MTTRTLRRVLLTVGVGLVAVIAGFVGYARYRARHFLQALPPRLGADVRQETNGFTYSQTLGGRTVFTIHASREVQRTNGRITLHDVGITLYGQTPDQADRIHGSEFEYDPAKGVLRAPGEVYLEVAAPTAASGSSNVSRTIHMKTSGVTFLEKQRTASTDRPIEFAAGGLTGSAVGALYDGARGLLQLQQEVRLTGLRDGHPLVLTASRAEFDRTASAVRLAAAEARQTMSNGTESLAADQMEVQLTPGSAPRLLTAEGRVLLTGARGASLGGDRLRVDFAQNSASVSILSRMQLAGDLHFLQRTSQGEEQGTAGLLNVLFDASGHPQAASFGGGVRLESRARGSTRVLGGGRIQLALAASQRGYAVVKTAEVFSDAADAAHLQMVSGTADSSARSGTVTTDLSANHLRAQFASSAATGHRTANTLQALDGDGQTVLSQTSTGVGGSPISGQPSSSQTSTGDVLRAAFADHNGKLQLVRAEQQGHVTVVRETAAGRSGGKVIAATVDRARAQTAAYDAASNHLLLSGNVLVAQAQDTLMADQITLDRSTGDVAARGWVRATYQPSGARQESGTGGDPLHVTAARSQFSRSSGMMKFFGRGPDGEPGTLREARLWQAGSQVQAQEIDLDQAHRQLVAKGGSSSVQAVLTGAGNQVGGVRVSSHVLTYTGASNRVDLTGPVRLTTGDIHLASDSATVFFANAIPAAQLAGVRIQPSVALLDGRLERVTAQGEVQVEQPGRRATGDKLVYTAADQTFVLTGTQSALPRLVDPIHGSISGVALRFRSSDDSVEILGGEGRRVESQTRLKPR